MARLAVAWVPCLLSGARKRLILLSDESHGHVLAHLAAPVSACVGGRKREGD